MFTIVMTGRNGFVKELATSKYVDIAHACALGIANRQWDPRSAYRDEGSSYLEIREGDQNGKTIGKVVLVKDQPRWVIE